MVRAATQVFTSGMARIKQAEDRDFKNVAASTLQAAELLDELDPVKQPEPAAGGSPADEVRKQRDRRLAEAEAAVAARRSSES